MATFGDLEEVKLTSTGVEVGGNAADELLTTGTKHSPFQEGSAFNLVGVGAVPIISDEGKVTSKRLVALLKREGSETLTRLFFSTVCRDTYDEKGNIVDRFVDRNSFGRSVNEADLQGGAEAIVRLLTAEENRNRKLVCHRISYVKEGGKKATWVGLAWALVRPSRFG